MKQVCARRRQSCRFDTSTRAICKPRYTIYTSPRALAREGKRRTHPLLRPSPHSASAARIISSSCGTSLVPLSGASKSDGHSPLGADPDMGVNAGGGRRARVCVTRGHLATPTAPRLPSGVTASISSSSVSSPAIPSPSLGFRSRSSRCPRSRGRRLPDLPANLAAAHAHSNVRWLPINSIRSREGGLAGGASGDEGMLSHRDA